MTDIAVERRIAADHPAFAGHFPGRPLLPGVLLLAEVMEALRGQAGDRTVTIEAAKFLSPVRPGDALHIHVHGDGASWRFEVRNGAAVAATGRLTVADAAAGEVS